MKKITITETIKHKHYEGLKNKLSDLKEKLKSSPYTLEDVLLSTPEKLYEITKWSKNKDFDFMKDKYKNFTNKKKEYNAYKLAENLGVNTCPYCNLNSIYTVIDNEENEIKNKELLRPEFDHFFDKATCPILSLSLYNLIPSCYQCNSNLKGSKKFDLENYLHPYIDDIDKEIKFEIKIKDVKFYYTVEGFEILVNTTSKKAENHNKVFRLKERYQYVKDIVLELIQKKYVYNEDYLKELFKKYEGTFFRNIEDLRRLISGGYVSDSEINKRPLSKLIKDITKQLGYL